MADTSADEGIHLIIVGAGLAGLSSALSTKLANPKHRVTMCEAVRELQEVGVGLPSPLTFLFPFRPLFSLFSFLFSILPVPPSSQHQA